MSSDYSNISKLIEEEYNNSKSIGIFASRFDESEGVGTVVNRHINKLNDAGIDVTLFAYEQVDEIAEKKVVNVSSNLTGNNTPNKLISLMNPLGWLSLSSRLKKLGLLIIHQPILCSIAYCVQKIHDIGTIYYNHGIARPEDKVETIQRIYGCALFQIYLHIDSRLDQIVSVSKYSQQEYSRRFNRQGMIIHNSIDHEMYNQSVDGSRIREKYDLENDPLVLFVGRIVRSKGVHKLIPVFEDVSKTIPDTTLTIVGRPNNQGYYQRVRVLSKSVDRQIILAGTVSKRDLPTYYSATDLYVTCLIKEGYNLTITEAEACGIPTIAFDTGAHSEVMNDGALVPKDNASLFKGEMVNQLTRQRWWFCSRCYILNTPDLDALLFT